MHPIRPIVRSLSHPPPPTPFSLLPPPPPSCLSLSLPIPRSLRATLFSDLLMRHRCARRCTEPAGYFSCPRRYLIAKDNASRLCDYTIAMNIAYAIETLTHCAVCPPPADDSSLSIRETIPRSAAACRCAGTLFQRGGWGFPTIIPRNPPVVSAPLALSSPLPPPPPSLSLSPRRRSHRGERGPYLSLSLPPG